MKFAHRRNRKFWKLRCSPNATYTDISATWRAQTLRTLWFWVRTKKWKKNDLDDEAPYVTYTDIAETTGARTTSRRHHRRRKSDEPATDTHQRNIKNVNISLEVSSILKTSKKHDFCEVVFFTKNIKIVLWFECGDDFCKTHVAKNQNSWYFIHFKGAKNRAKNACAPKY